MASLVKTYKGDLTTFIAGKIWEFVKNRAKKGSEDIEDEEPTKQSGQPSSVSSVTSIVPVPKVGSLATSRNVDPKTEKITNIINNLKDVINSNATPGEKENARAALKKYTKKLPRYERGFFPKNFNSGIKVTDEKLGVFLAKLALSLSSSFNSINEKLNETDDGITATKDGINKTYKKLEQNSDSLESKLDAIIEALRYSGDIEKQKRDQREAAAKIAQQREDIDLSNTNRILMQDMDRQEVRDLQRENLADDMADDAEIGDQGQEPNLMDDIPQLAEGGIVSGPDSGYLAVLHGDEAVIPLDNNYTQGQPSAVGQTPVSEMPMMAERGINPGENLPSMKPKFTPNIASSTPMVSRSPFSKSTDGDHLAKAIQLPVKAAGLVTMGIMSKVLENFSLPPRVVAGMKQLTSPIAKSFGIPDVMTGDLASDIESGHRMSEQRRDFRDRNRQTREKGLFQRFKEFLFGTPNTPGTGGGMTYRGMGGNTYVNNRTSGTGGGIAFFGGKKKEKVYKSKQDFGTILRRTAETDAMMVINGFGDPERFKKKYGLTAEQFMALPEYPTDQSSLDSNVFAKNVNYDNAFDYYNSPEYGLRTSEIAYNMSMADEVNNIMDGLSDPDNQVILNNHTASTNAGKQVEYSPIAVRGNPLKDGTYISPYSV